MDARQIPRETKLEPTDCYLQTQLTRNYRRNYRLILTLASVGSTSLLEDTIQDKARRRKNGGEHAAGLAGDRWKGGVGTWSNGYGHDSCGS